MENKFLIRNKSGKFLKGGCGGWNGGKTSAKGYVYIYSPKHPFRVKGTYVLEHRLIMEKCLGRYLKPEEIIHHLNGNITDNREENLRLFKNNSEHSAYHKEKGYSNLSYTKNIEELLTQISNIKKNYTWKNFALKLGVSEKALRTWNKRTHRPDPIRIKLLEIKLKQMETTNA